MKILFLSQFPLYGNGSGNYTRNLAKQLQENGHEVAIASPGKLEGIGVETFPINPAYQAVFFSHPEWKKATRYRDLSNRQIIEQYCSFLAGISSAVEKFRPEVIHLNHCFMLTWVANYIRSVYGIGFVVTAHGTGILQSTTDKRFYPLTRQALEKADGLFPVSTHTRKWMLRAFGRRLAWKTRIITPGLSEESLIIPKSTRKIEDKYNLKGKKVVIFVGRLTPEKGVEYLIKAAPKIHGEVYVIGGGSYKDQLEKRVKQQKVKNVHFLGYFGKEYLDELRQFYKRANVLVLPTIVNEAMPLVILEAMAARTPVVASKKGGVPLATKDGRTGILVRARSSSGIVAAVNRILDDEQLERQLGEEARKLVQERFLWDRIAKALSSWYERAGSTTERLKKARILEDRDLQIEIKELRGE